MQAAAVFLSEDDQQSSLLFRRQGQQGAAAHRLSPRRVSRFPGELRVDVLFFFTGRTGRMKLPFHDLGTWQMLMPHFCPTVLHTSATLKH